MPSFMSLEKYVLEILLNAFLSEPIKPANFGKNVKPFMLISEFFDTIHKIFRENLSNFFAASPNHKPSHHKLRKRL